MAFSTTTGIGDKMEDAKKKTGPVDSLSRSEKKANKRRTNVVRRNQRVEHPDDLGQESHMRYHDHW